MILQEYRGQLLVVRQSDHGIQTGLFAERWGNDETPPFGPRQPVIDAGTRHLRAMMLRFRYDLRLAIAAYNAGEKPVLAHGGVPPYPETRQYVTQVLRLYNTPGEPRLWRNELYRIVRPNGTVVYTNIAFGQVGGVSHGR